MGAALLLSGIVAALTTAPLFDRVFTSHIALVIRVLCPTIGAAWLGLIWAGSYSHSRAQRDRDSIEHAVRTNDDGALYALFAIIGACSVALLPIGTPPSLVSPTLLPNANDIGSGGARRRVDAQRGWLERHALVLREPDVHYIHLGCVFHCP